MKRKRRHKNRGGKHSQHGFIRSIDAPPVYHVEPEDFPDRRVHKRDAIHVLYEEQGGICAYCGKKMTLEFNHASGHSDMATREHLRPQSKGGSDDISNLMAACAECNHERGNMPMGVYMVKKHWARELNVA